jgi:hypothetical protein
VLLSNVSTYMSRFRKIKKGVLRGFPKHHKMSTQRKIMFKKDLIKYVNNLLFNSPSHHRASGHTCGEIR